MGGGVLPSPNSLSQTATGDTSWNILSCTMTAYAGACSARPIRTRSRSPGGLPEKITARSMSLPSRWSPRAKLPKRTKRDTVGTVWAEKFLRYACNAPEAGSGTRHVSVSRRIATTVGASRRPYAPRRESPFRSDATIAPSSSSDEGNATGRSARRAARRAWNSQEGRNHHSIV